MDNVETTLLTAVEGPKGKADIYEVSRPEPSGVSGFPIQ